jgi:RNA polymerase sigma-70 factor, ECF subfamily
MLTTLNASQWCRTKPNDASPPSEDMLVSLAKTGQDWAFVELCHRHSRRILFTLYRITKSREDAEDAFQESILKAFVHFGNFNRASSFGTWFTRININSALMMLRKKRNRLEISTDAPLDECVGSFNFEIADRRPNPEDHYILCEDERRLRSAISQLPASYRCIFEIRHRSDGSLKEIADEVGITVAATKSRLLRARKALVSSL